MKRKVLIVIANAGNQKELDDLIIHAIVSFPFLAAEISTTDVKEVTLVKNRQELEEFLEDNFVSWTIEEKELIGS